MSDVIVTGTDGSETARAATMLAARLAALQQAELVVVSAFEKLQVEEVDADGRRYVFTTEDSASMTAQEAVRQAKLIHPGLNARAVAAQGKPANVLVEVASEATATLIVVGNRRVQGVARVLGSIATDVAHKAPCDVYIAHTHGND